MLKKDNSRNLMVWVVSRKVDLLAVLSSRVVSQHATCPLTNNNLSNPKCGPVLPMAKHSNLDLFHCMLMRN